MKLSEEQRLGLMRWAHEKHIGPRPPDFRIGSINDPYLLRWFEVRLGREWLRMPADERRRIILDKQHGREQQAIGREFEDNVFVHQFWRSDDDRALHDHPWPWTTIILEGRYIEHLPADAEDPAGPTVQHLRSAGDMIVRHDASAPHRVELIDEPPVTTLFLTGPKEREWGFWCPQGWRHWRKFTANGDSGKIGRGCA